jgi:N-acetylneuraminate synthase
MLIAAARLGRPLIVSTGMATLEEIDEALSVIAFGLTCTGDPVGRASFEEARISDEGKAALGRQVTLLHCTTQYPAPAEAVNLRAMNTLSAAFDLRVGYSDHTLGTAVSIAAVARGASVIEKHFTLDRTMNGPDHAASLEPSELMAMVSDIRTVEAALGSERKGPDPVEFPNLLSARRSLVAARPIAAGSTIAVEDLTAKRPGDGISPMRIWEFVGKTAEHDYDSDELIRP